MERGASAEDQSIPFGLSSAVSSHFKSNFCELEMQRLHLKNGLIVGNAVSFSYNRFKNRFKLL